MSILSLFVLIFIGLIGFGVQAGLRRRGLSLPVALAAGFGICFLLLGIMAYFIIKALEHM